MDKEIYIISVATKEYFKMLKGLISSSVLKFPQAKFFITLVNMDKRYSHELLKISKDIEFNYDDVFFKSKEHQFIYCTNRRATLLKRFASKKRNSILIWLDADSIFTKDASDFYNEIIKDDYCVCFFQKGRLKKGIRRIMGGLIVVDTSKKDSLSFLKLYAKNVPIDLHKKIIIGKKKHNRNLRLNQRWLRRKFVVKYEDKMKMKFLSYPYISTSEKDSIIWSPDVENKYKDDYQELVEQDIKTVILKNKK